MKHLAVLLLLCAPVTAQENISSGSVTLLGVPQICPADRPHARTVKSPYGRCTLMACLPKIVCSPDGETCQELMTNDCNTCTYDTHEVCLSDEDLHKAESVGGFTPIPR